MERKLTLELLDDWYYRGDREHRYYLAHPFDSRHQMRAWELGVESCLGLNIYNPFYDGHRSDVEAIDAGRHARYEKIDPATVVERDVDAIAKSDGVIALVNGDLSYGTIQEIVYATMLDIPVYLVCTNNHHDHPWLCYHSEHVFHTLSDLEMFLIKEAK